MNRNQMFNSISQSKVDLESTLGYCWIVIVICNKVDRRFKMNFPNSEFLSKNGLYLPSGLAIKNNEIKYICLTLNKLLNY